MPLNDIVEESQSTPFASQRAVADACEVAVRVEAVAAEQRHNTLILHVTILHYGIEDNLAVGINILQLVPGHRLQKRRHRENGTRREPTADVVARDVEQHRVVGYGEDVVLQLLEVAYAAYLLARHRVAEDEVAKPEVLFKDMPEVDVHLLRVLVNELEALGKSTLAVLRFRTLHYQGQILVAAAYLLQQFESRLRVLLQHMGIAVAALHGETAVGDNAQRIVMILLVELHRLLIVTRQHHLRASAHAHRGTVGVQCLGGETLTLSQNIIIKVGQHAAIEPYVVFHKQYHLHASLLYVVLDVHLVLYQLNDRKDEVGITQPAEDIVEHTHVLVLNAARDAVTERGEHHTRHLGELRLHVAGHGKSVVVGIARHADDEVDARRFHHLFCLFCR